MAKIWPVKRPGLESLWGWPMVRPFKGSYEREVPLGKRPTFNRDPKAERERARETERESEIDIESKRGRERESTYTQTHAYLYIYIYM